MGSNYQNINDILINKFNWSKNQIGPFGQFYRIDVDKNNNQSFLTLHNLVVKKFGGNAKTYICDLFTINGKMIIKNNDLLKSNYSEKKAMKARQKYMATGQISDEEWALVDQKSWLTYIGEGTNSNKSEQEVFNKELTIKNCTSHKTTVQLNNKTITFPNLILTMPPYIYLDINNIK